MRVYSPIMVPIMDVKSRDPGAAESSTRLPADARVLQKIRRGTVTYVALAEASPSDCRCPGGSCGQTRRRSGWVTVDALGRVLRDGWGHGDLRLAARPQLRQHRLRSGTVRGHRHPPGSTAQYSNGWLQDNRQVQIICRDRGPGYGAAAAEDRVPWSGVGLRRSSAWAGRVSRRELAGWRWDHR